MRSAPVLYVTADSAEWLTLDAPDGMVPPPVLRLHRPLIGYVEFYYASCYNLPAPAGAPTEVT